MTNGLYETIDSLMPWFREKPRTYGWDALMALDRNKTNHVLLQEYIQRYGSDTYIQPISDTVELTNSFQQFLGYRFDKPRVSFEDASLNGPDLKMTLRSVGGTYLLWVGNTKASAELTRIEKIAPHAGHTYTATVPLVDSPLAINSRRVVLNLKNGTNPTLDSTRFSKEQEKSGQEILNLFEKMTDEQTTFALSELRYTEHDPIKPEEIAIRTQRSADPKDGDGAILVFVKMVDGKAGGFPGNSDTEWRYLLNPSSHSAMIILSNEFLMRTAGARGLDRLINHFAGYGDGNFTTKVEMDTPLLPQFKRLIVNDVSFVSYQRRIDPEGAPVYPNQSIWVRLHYGIDFMTGEHAGVTMRAHDDKFFVNWRTTANLIQTEYNTSGTYFTIFESRAAGLDALYDWFYSVRVVDNRLLFDSHLAGRYPFNWTVAVGNQDLDSQTTARVLAAAESHVLNETLPPHMNEFLGALQELNAAHLSNLLFASKVPLDITGARIPGDLVMYGHINPELTAFTLYETELTLELGALHSFRWSGFHTPTFDCEWADGSGADLGEFLGGGDYRAPRTLPEGRDFVRIRIIAETAVGKAYALLTVVASGFDVNPVVQMVAKGSSPEDLRMGGLFEGVAQYHSSAGGVVEFKAQDNDQTLSSYFAPEDYRENVAVDALTFTAGGHSASAYVVNYKSKTLALALNRSQSRFAERLAHIELASGFQQQGQVAAAVNWSVIYGGGQFIEQSDAHAVYRAPEQPAIPFAVIECHVQIGSNISLYGYQLLPQPLDVLSQEL